MNMTFLVLADGSVFPGKGFGQKAPLATELKALQNPSEFSREPALQPAGEVVFNTGMCGYPEIITDPSYAGQLVTMTYPHIGNYGVDPLWSENTPGESSRKGRGTAAGLIVRDVYSGPLPPGRISLDLFLQEQGISAITEVDTRRLTLHLRDNGSQNGVIVDSALSPEQFHEKELPEVLAWLAEFPQMGDRDMISQVATTITTRFDAKQPGEIHMVLIDYGSKANIIEELVKRGVTVTLVPSQATAEEILKLSPDAVFLSNGPGDPAVLTKEIEVITALMGKLPLFGICLGHQLIAHALGAKTEKMKFGHHGVNHPVRDLQTGKVFVTSQNHGYMVTPGSLPEEVEPWFVNANDGSLEGLYHKELPIMSVQYHPEAAPGPHDASWIFDTYIEKTKNTTGGNNASKN